MEEDDEFGDFGGFEAAEAVVQADPQLAEGAGLQAAPSPWAMYAASASGSLSIQPDLIQPQQNAAAVNLPEVAQRGMSGQEQLAENDPSDATFDADFDGRLGGGGKSVLKQSGMRSITEQVLEPDFGRGPNARVHHPIPDGVLDLDLSAKTHVLPVSDFPLDAASSAASSTTIGPDAVGPHPGGVVMEEMPLQSAQSQPVTSHNREAGDVQAASDQITNDVADLEKVVKALEGEQTLLQQQLQEASQRLAEQQSLYKKMQEHHEVALSLMKQAGHDALAVVVEEYKELCKVAVREERDSCMALLRDSLADERQILSQSLKEEQALLQRRLTEHQEEMEAVLKDALHNQADEHKRKMEKVIEEESQKSKIQLQTAIQEEQERGTRLLEDAVRAERAKTKELQAEEKDKMQRLVEEMREQNKQLTDEMLAEERLNSKANLEAALVQEREKGEETVHRVMAHAKSDMKAHLEEEKKADALVRQRALATMDVFLEGARKQLGLLMDSPLREEGSSP